MKKLLLLCLIALLSVSVWATDNDYSFHEGDFFYNIISENTVEVTWESYELTTGTESYTGDMEVPSSVEHDGITYDVTRIGEKAFYECRSLTSIILPESIQSIGERAFYSCNYLTSVNIPEGITVIEDNAFFQCSRITSLTLPSTIITIGVSAFSNCSKITSINLPEGLTTIGDYAFNGCSGIKSIEFPSTLTTLKDWAFANSGLTSVTVPATIESIGEGVFYSCEDLCEVTFGEGYNYIGDSMFGYCMSLGEIFIPNTITYFGKEAFEACSSLSNVALEDGLKLIGDYAFAFCMNLEEIYIPETVINIGDNAFLSCEMLSTVTLNDGLSTIGEFAFSECSELREITIPGSVADIGRSVFESDTNLEEVFLEEGIPYISDYMFIDCAINAIELPSTITSIGNYAFSGTNLDGINLPDVLTSIGNYAFNRCSGLKNITFPDGLEYIGEYAFYRCGLTSVNIPKSVTYLGESAFYDNTSLTEATILANIGEINSNTFRGCSYLTTVSIPKTVTNIYNQAFYSCQRLASFTSFNREAPICGTNVFNSVPTTTCTLYVPIGSEEAYGSAPTWENFSNIVGIEVEDDPDEEETKFVEDGIYYQCIDKDALTIEVTYESTVFYYYTGSVNIPSTVTHNGQKYTVIGIGDDAFRLSPELTDVTIPEGITYIGEYAFYNCTALKEISLPKGLLDIGVSAFRGCTTLAEIAISPTVTSIGESAFRDCSSLTKLTIPASVTTIGISFISGCTSLDMIIFEDGGDPLETFITQTAGTFVNCSFTSLYLGRTLTYDALSISYTPLSGIKSLKNLTFGEQEISVGNYLFRSTGIEELNVPENVSIGQYSFYHCDSLKSATIGAKSIGANAFRDCSALEELTLLETITSIGNYAFDYCEALEEVIVSTNAGSSFCFDNCTALRKLTFAENIYRIYDNMYRCSGLEEIYSLNPTPPSAYEYSLYGAKTETCVVYVPVGSKEDYEQATIWEDFFNIVEISSELLVETVDAVDITDTSALLSGTVINEYNDFATEQGFEYWNDENDKSTVVGEVEGNNLMANLSDLHYGTTYTYRAYAINTRGAVYGEELTFTTDLYAPAIETLEATDVAETTAVLNGTVEQGSEPINSKGFVYWDGDPNVMEVIIISDEDVEMSYTLNSLTPETTYTYRAFATTDSGTTYGDDVDFTTLEDTTTGINGISIDSENVEGIYSTSGQKLNTAQKGVNIIRYTDGSVKKIYVK